MNHSLLLVVCDFLLLSILSLARFDVGPDAVIATEEQKVVKKNVTEWVSDGENYDDVVAELEATNETLEANLLRDKDDLESEKLRLEEEIEERRLELEQKEDLIAQKDDVISDNKVAIDEAAKAAAKLELANEDIERKREELLARNAAAKKEVELLASNLATAKKEADELAAQKARTESEVATARVNLAKAEEQAKAKAEVAAKAEEALASERKRGDELVKSTAAIDDRIDALNSGLKDVGTDLKTVGSSLAGVGERISNVTDEVAGVKASVSDVSQEVAGVKATVTNVSEEVAGVGDKVQNVTQQVADIAETTTEAVAEQKEALDKISERQAKSLNEIYSNYVANKVKLTMTFRHKGGFLGAEKVDTYETETIILVDGTFAYTLVHAKDSPFRLEPQYRKLIEVSGRITGKGIKAPILVNEVAFMDDPRMLIVPVYVNPRELEEKNDVKLFRTPKDPHMFSEAVVVDVGHSNFGQTDFIRDGVDGRYIRVKHNRFTFITGKFDPGKGDLVFAKSGEVLGIMVNNDYAFHIQNLGARIRMGTRTPLGKSFDAPKTTDLLANLGKSLKTLQQKFR
ncbi:MAG: hypothetical protein CMI26_06230 [Opitutae bacterium]|nr:hypothetical protein [Opitutae bacterium]|tara:strand:- start:1762 stop:3483 length:1722 start_codon:yes stop_codon:yes gene_type:complete